MNENSLSHINPLSELLASDIITEAKISELADKITAEILENGMGVNELVLMNALKKLCEGVDERLRHKVDVSKAYDSYKGCKITTGNTGARLSYEDDAEYSRIKDLLDARKELLSNAFKNSSIEMTDTNNGEVLPIVSIKTPNKEIIKLSFPKK